MKAVRKETEKKKHTFKLYATMPKGNSMSPDSLKPLDVFHEAHTTPMEDEV